MPWNDNANPGPWGTPPSGEGGDKQPQELRPATRRRWPTPSRRPWRSWRTRYLGDPRPADRAAARPAGRAGGPGDGIRPGAVAAVAGAGFAIWALSGLYIVQPNEEAVVTTFGAYSRSESPGLRYHLPTPSSMWRRWRSPA
uniref:Menbrane protein HflK N-terminal domain-containing protein n=1 Tax=Phenylobacterium glaciei TaxID=2803784 RepID=A0A974P509_9CAUL|nr:hypothetical protein JKL49_09810 [Phenylobacterium glaciei]